MNQVWVKVLSTHTLDDEAKKSSIEAQASKTETASTKPKEKKVETSATSSTLSPTHVSDGQCKRFVIQDVPSAIKARKELGNIKLIKEEIEIIIISELLTYAHHWLYKSEDEKFAKKLVDFYQLDDFVRAKLILELVYEDYKLSTSLTDEPNKSRVENYAATVLTVLEELGDMGVSLKFAAVDLNKIPADTPDSPTPSMNRMLIVSLEEKLKALETRMHQQVAAMAISPPTIHTASSEPITAADESGAVADKPSDSDQPESAQATDDASPKPPQRKTFLRVVPKQFFLSRVKKNVKVDAIKTILDGNDIEEAEVELKSHGDSKYHSFKISIPPKFEEKILNKEIWPKGSRIQKWYYRENNKTKEEKAEDELYDFSVGGTPILVL